jgi:hypothetical protein
MRELNGVEMIAQERRRQVDVEGWTPEHDRQHYCGELPIAAACYASLASAQARWSSPLLVYELPKFWPWALKWWKPSTDPLRNLAKAGALIAAEIDRILTEQEKHDA